MTTEQLKDLRDAIDADLAGKPVQFRIPHGNEPDRWWNADAHPSFDNGVLWRPKPEPKTRPWSKPEDVPMPVCWIRTKDRTESDVTALVVSVSSRGFEYSIKCDRFIPWRDTAKITALEYSTDGKTWHKCEVQES